MFFFLVLCFFIGSNCYPSVWLDSVWMSAVIVLTLCVASLIIFYSSRNVTQTVERKITMIQFSYSSCNFSCPDLFCEQPFIVWPRETEKDLERKTNVYSLGGGVYMSSLPASLNGIKYQFALETNLACPSFSDVCTFIRVTILYPKQLCFFSWMLKCIGFSAFLCNISPSLTRPNKHD